MTGANAILRRAICGNLQPVLLWPGEGLDWSGAGFAGRRLKLNHFPGQRRSSLYPSDSYCSGPCTCPVTTLRMVLDEGRPA